MLISVSVLYCYSTVIIVSVLITFIIVGQLCVTLMVLENRKCAS